MRLYNKRREDFGTKMAWDDYLEMTEDISESSTGATCFNAADTRRVDVRSLQPGPSRRCRGYGSQSARVQSAMRSDILSAVDGVDGVDGVDVSRRRTARSAAHPRARRARPLPEAAAAVARATGRHGCRQRVDSRCVCFVCVVCVVSYSHKSLTENNPPQASSKHGRCKKPFLLCWRCSVCRVWGGKKWWVWGEDDLFTSPAIFATVMHDHHPHGRGQSDAPTIRRVSIA